MLRPGAPPATEATSRPAGSAAAGARYIPTLDGWRGLAVIGVILYHGQSEFFSGRRALSDLSAHGFLGVDLFFAISGFLICGLLLEEYRAKGTIDLQRFYMRRCFRILPPYYATLAGLCAASAFGVIRFNSLDLPSCLLFFRNYKPLGIDEQGGFYTAHFWTLAVEEHFYLVWPLLLLLVKPKRAGKVALVLAFAVFLWRLLEEHSGFLAGVLPAANVMERTDTRVDALLWGCIAAICFRTVQHYVERIRFSELWLPVLLVLLFVEKVHAPGLTLWRAILLPALVLSTVTQPHSRLSRLLEWRPLRWIGAISYSLYLWQELFLPVMASEKSTGAFHYLQQPPWNIPAILLFACLSRYLLELPMIRLGRRLGAARAPARSLRVPAA